MIYVLYHASCRDGFGAAYAAWKFFGDEPGVKYIAVTHGNPPPKMQDKSHVYILDFSYDRKTLLELKDRMHSVKVLDHHMTAQQELKDLPFAEFDMDRSGAVMAWNNFHPTKEVPRWMLHIQDRDLWKFSMEDTEEITEAILTYPYTFEAWDAFDTGELYHIGRGVLRYKKSYVNGVVRNPIWKDIGGYRVPVVNTGSFISSVANRLCSNHPQAEFAACYFDVPGRRVWSLRSIGEFDVGAVAKSLGGGGHKNSSGFTEENIP